MGTRALLTWICGLSTLTLVGCSGGSGGTGDSETNSGSASSTGPGEECVPYTNAPPGEVTVMIHNLSAAPIYIDNAYTYDGIESGYFVERAFGVRDENGELELDNVCPGTCAGYMSGDGCFGCDPGMPYRYNPFKLAPGATFTETWDGLTRVSADMPASCVDISCQNDGGDVACARLEEVAGDVTVYARVSTEIDCGSAPSGCDCDPGDTQCALGGNNEAPVLVDPVELVAPVTVPGATEVELLYTG